MLQEGVMQTRRDVGWVGGLQHGSIFNEKKVVSVAWCKHRRLTCALTERDKLERKSKRSMSTWQERRGQGWARFSASMPELELCFEFNATLPWECCPDHIFVSRTWTAGAILIKTKYKRGSCHFPSPEQWIRTDSSYTQLSGENKMIPALILAWKPTSSNQIQLQTVLCPLQAGENTCRMSIHMKPLTEYSCYKTCCRALKGWN